MSSDVLTPELFEISYDDVHKLARSVRNELTAALAGSEVTPLRRRAVAADLTVKMVGAWVDENRRQREVTEAEEEAMIDAVTAEIEGTGRLQALLDDPHILNVNILGYDQVQIQYRDGRFAAGKAVADSDEHLIALLQNLARRAEVTGSTERSLSPSEPKLDLQLPDGSRLTAIYKVSQRPTVAIRKHSGIADTLDDLIGAHRNMIDPLIRDFLYSAIKSRRNIAIFGEAASGKTTFMRACASCISADEWFVTLESSRELGLHTTGNHPWAVALEAREGFGERDHAGKRAGEISVDDLFPVTLRLNTRRVLVGEIRDGEIHAALQAMSTTGGSMCTIHARDFEGVFDRLVDLALQRTGESSAQRIFRQVAGAIDFIVYVQVIDERDIGGREHRFVSHILEVDGVTDDGSNVRYTTVFGPGADGRAVPQHSPSRQMLKLRRAGWNPAPFHQNLKTGLWPRPLQLHVSQADTP